jgi:hypothetical protein
MPPAEAPAPAPASASVPETASVPAPPVPLPAAPAPGLEREFRGAYTRGFEASWFAPCESPMDDALWWVTLTEDARLQRDSMLKALTVPATGALAVRWRGTVSARMPAGQMGRGTRYLLVTRIVELRPLPSDGACGVGGKST